MTALALGGWRGRIPRAVRRSVLTASTFNVAYTAAAGVTGILIARSLGPSVRGEYAAIMVWFALALVVGGLGQPAATTYFVAHDPARARDYVATSRTLLLASGAAAFAIGAGLAPWLGADGEAATWGYRIMFATCLAAFAGVTYIFALQASSIPRWNFARTSQPVCYLAAVLALHATGRLTLLTAVAALAVTIVAQTALAYGLCARRGLTGGRPRRSLARPLSRYGAAQAAAAVPVLVVSKLDQLVLSLAVAPAVLGNYAVAASVTTLAVPLAAGLGNVAFPRIAARRGAGGQATARLQWAAVAVSAATGLAVLAPLVAVAPWLVPAVFGTGFREAVVLAALLAPRGLCWTCQQVCADLLRGHGRPFDVARAQLTGAVVVVGLLVLLLPAWGARGVAVSASASAAVALLLLLRALHRVLGRERAEEATP